MLIQNTFNLEHTYIISIFILQPKAPAPSSGMARHTRDIMATRTVEYEKRVEYCKGIQHCVEECRMFEKRNKHNIRPADYILKSMVAKDYFQQRSIESNKTGRYKCRNKKKKI